MKLDEELKKFVVHCKKDKYDVYVGRPSKWGNCFSHLEDSKAEFKTKTREESVRKYFYWVQTQPELMNSLHELKGKILGCWCSPQLCHGHMLAQLANDEGDPWLDQPLTKEEEASFQYCIEHPDEGEEF